MDDESQITLAAVQKDAKYDAQSKAIWRHKELVAPILQKTVIEFGGMSIQEILTCLDEPVFSNEDAVDDISSRVTTIDSEMSSISDKLIRYDIHFLAKNPKLSTDKIRVMLHIDLEIQNEYKPDNPEYPMTKRAVYYAARELSGQLGILTETTNYAKLEKVYSIWICNENIPEDMKNSITRFSICKEVITGKDEEPDEYHDLIDVVIVRRGEKPEDNSIFDYIDAVYSNDVSRVIKYTDIDNNQDIRKELGKVMTASQSLIAKGIQQGIQQGVEQGVKKGRDEEREQIIQNITDNYLKNGLASSEQEAREKAIALISGK